MQHTQYSNHTQQGRPIQGPHDGLHPVIHQLLELRGWNTPELKKEFLSWDLKSLPDFGELKDLEKSAMRIIQAMDSGETIGIYGDYDVDGTTSCALFFHFFKMFETEVQLIQPSRFVEGYGIHPSSIEKAKENKIDLLITVDCGITAHGACEKAEELGLDLIITDHHADAGETMISPYAVVNPNRRDEPSDSPLKVLAGVGVAFAVCWEVRRQLLKTGRPCPSLYPLLQFVAIGTVCDLAPITPVNAKLVRHGLKQLGKGPYPGVLSFLDQEERKLEITPSEKLSFQIGPLINSKGRLEHPRQALELLTVDDFSMAHHLHGQLAECNNQRKAIQAEVYAEAKLQILEKLNQGNLNISMAYAPDWHEGVIGIVASKLVEEFKLPAIVLSNSEEEGVIKASARSAGELNLFDCLKRCEEFFLKFGGHKSAAGLSMKKDLLPAFEHKLNSILGLIPLEMRTNQNSFDLEIDALDINPNLVRQLETLEPFGIKNERPVFKIKNLVLTNFDILKEKHVRWNFQSPHSPHFKLKGISFNYLGKWQAMNPQEILDQQNQTGVEAIGGLGINRWKNREYINLMAQSVILPS